MPVEDIGDRFAFAQNCLKRFAEFDASASDSLGEEIDYLRKSILCAAPSVVESNEHMKKARESFPQYILLAILALIDLNLVFLQD